MGMLEDIMKALDRLPGWKRLQQAPAEIDALRARIEMLETKLAPATGEECPICRARAFKRTASKPDETFAFAGIMRDSFSCAACGHSEERIRDPSKR